MDEEAFARQQQRMEVTRREMYRKSRDIIRVFNPLDHPYRFMYDSFWHSVPSKGSRDMERYLAQHYFKKISEFMIGQQMLTAGDKLKKVREQQMGRAFLDKYDENKEVWDRTPQLDDENLLKEIRDIVILGLVEEYGMDFPEDLTPASSRVETRTIQDIIFDDFNKKVVEPASKSELDDITV